MNDFEEPRRNALRALREMIPPELTRVMVEADFAGRYEQVCEQHPPRLQSLTGSQRHAAPLALQRLGRVHRSPGGNHAITVADQPAGMVFEVSWRADTRVEAFLSLSEAELRCGSNFAILTHAARTHPVSPGKPTHPRPYAADGDELHAVVAELLALAVEVGKKFAVRPGADLNWRAPMPRVEPVAAARTRLARRARSLVQIQPPVPASDADLSHAAVLGATLKSTLRVGLGVFGAAFAVVMVPALLLSPVATYLVAGTAVVMFVLWASQVSARRRQRATEYVRRINADLAARTIDMATALRSDLADLDFQPGLAQIASLHEQFTAFAAMLRRKLDPAELTYARYLGMSEQVYLAGLDNLGRIVDTLDALSAIDVAHISRRLRHLETDGIESQAQDLEIRTLKERLQLLEGQQARVSELLAENEAAMTRLVQAGSAIAAMDTTTPRAQFDMETAMHELKILIERAPAYSRDA